jgi:hypothetical protein
MKPNMKSRIEHRHSSLPESAAQKNDVETAAKFLDDYTLFVKVEQIP